MDTQSLDTQIAAKQGEYDAAVEAECCPPPKSCDPIGFAMTDENGDQVKYDFIVDDGEFDSTSDFLGADNQWAAMQALDTDGNGTVSSEELAAGNIKAVKTDANGNKTVVDLATEFGSDFSIDLNSYKEGGSYAGIGNSDADGDGVLDQELLGTFNLNINGQSVQGYNTLDDVDWLSENYKIAGADAVQDANSTDLDASQFSEDLQPHVEFLNTYTQKVAELRAELEQVYEGLGISKEDMANYNEVASLEADQKAANFFESLETEESDETEADDESKVEDNEANQANAAQANSNADVDADEKDEDELEDELDSKAA